MDNILAWLSNDGVLQRIALSALTPLLTLSQRHPNLDLRPLSVDSLSDEEIHRLWNESSPVNNVDSFGGNVRRIAPDTVAKATFFSTSQIEMDTANFVRIHTDIPVPRVHRFVGTCDIGDESEQPTIILSRYIAGRTLGQCWNTLGVWMKFRIALTLRYYIRQLRSLTSSVPGPVGQEPQLCYGIHFGDGAVGPFPSYKELSAYYASLLEKTRKWAEAMKKPPLDLTPFDDSTPLVMTHHDLNDRNIILGDDNQLWLIDWERSGYYPEWFEYSGFKALHDRIPGDASQPDLRPFIHLIAGKYEKPGQILFFSTIYRALLLGW